MGLSIKSREYFERNLSSAMPKLTKIPYEESYENHYKDLSTASHEIMNYVATIASTYQYLDVRYPQTGDFKFWDSLGVSIDHLSTFMKQTALCRYGHFPKKVETDIFSLVGEINNSLRDCPYEDIRSHLHISQPQSNTGVFCDPIHVAAAVHQLIVNAYEAQSDTADASIDMTLTAENDGMLSILISNPGTIPEDRRDYALLSSAFYTTKQYHAGVGLYAANIVCANHGGFLSIGCDDTTTNVSINISLN